MSLRELAEADLGVMMEDPTCGFGWPITLTDPDGNVRALTGLSDDIALAIDPDTGQAVSGRICTAALRISSIYAAGLALPKGISDTAGRPWKVEFNDINGLPYFFKVRESMPDRAAGVIVLTLEGYSV